LFVLSDFDFIFVDLARDFSFPLLVAFRFLALSFGSDRILGLAPLQISSYFSSSSRWSSPGVAHPAQ
jgi:hypothetical protein